ncbi:MAG: type-F conjugative transfer system pilin assembly protein TrbC [Alphaproteobacteria bacterium]|nr:type-F conjugative transfer system pilin assembly protein TrbC [Alphaproteobacteria bacterium]
MLHPLVPPLFLFLFSALEAKATCSQAMSCPSRLQEGPLSEGSLLECSLLERSLEIIETVQKDKDFRSFLTESSQQRDAALENKEFQDVVATLRASTLPAQKLLQSSENPTGITRNTPAELTLFVSFSLGEKALLNLAHEAKAYGATLVLRGFKNNSYAQTVKILQKIIQATGQGFIIDPELFSLFSISSVPTYVLSRPFQLQTFEPKTLESHALERTQTPIHDRLQGHVSLQYALETFAKEGDLKEEAKALLENTQLGGGNSK